MVLIITNKEDTHPTPVIRILKDWGIPVFRLNTEALLTDYHFCWWCNPEKTDFWIKNIQNGLEIQGSDIISVWDRRPEEPSKLCIENEEIINKHNLKEALGFLRFLRYYIKDIYSIGSIANDRIASSKMLQLKIAKEVGLQVPETCFSNRKNDIINFAAQHKDIILKSIENDSIWDEDKDQEFVFYAKKVNTASLYDIQEEAFSQTANYVQQYIEKSFELRITVIEDRIFACKIDSQILDEDKGKVDWRQGYDHGLKHERYNLPSGIKMKCIAFLKQMGLRFGCFDFIFTPESEYVFLECNPNGQWLWVEQETGMEISEAIAIALTTNYRKERSYQWKRK